MPLLLGQQFLYQCLKKKKKLRCSLQIQTLARPRSQPRRGTAVAEIKEPSVQNPELKGSPF